MIRFLTDRYSETVNATLFGDIPRCPTGHYYYNSRQVTSNGQRACSVCGDASVQWQRLHTLATHEIGYLFEQLPREAVRVKWWIDALDAKAEVSLALLRDARHLREHIERRLTQSLNRLYRRPDGRLAPFRDGRQTPYTGHVLYYAQHATATCCRKCVACWHGITEGREITPTELAYLTEVVLAYLSRRFLVRSAS